MKNLSLLIILAFLLLFPICVLAQTCEATGSGKCYYMSPAGSDGNDGSYDHPWATLSFAGSKLSHPGDVLYVRGGEYPSLTDRLQTMSSGTQTDPITVKAYPGETPVFRSFGDLSSNQYPVIWSNGHSWWVIDGLQIKPIGDVCIAHAISLAGNNHTIKNVVVEGATFTTSPCTSKLPGDYSYYATIALYGSDNEIYNCNLSKSGTHLHIDSEHPEGRLMGPSGTLIYIVSGSNRNKIHDNIFQKGVHDVFDLRGDYNHIYNNTFVHTVGYGLMINGGNHNLFEYNNITGCDEELAYMKSPTLHNWGDYNIIRYNVGWNNENVGIGLYSSGPGNTRMNRYYNNVMYNNGGSAFSGYNNGGANNNKMINNVFARNMWDPGQIASGYYGEISSFFGFVEYLLQNNQFLNNYIVSYVNGAWQDDYARSVYLNTLGRFYNVSYMQATYPTLWADNIYNYCDIKFADPDNGNFALEDGSCLIDTGMHLTTATNSGSSSTNLVVADAAFFWPSDDIVIGDSLRTAVSIDYETNTITLDTSATWSAGAYVDLPYGGDKPDIGAFEVGVDDPNRFHNGDDNGSTHASGCTIAVSGNGAASSIFVIVLVSLALLTVIRVKSRRF